MMRKGEFGVDLVKCTGGIIMSGRREQRRDECGVVSRVGVCVGVYVFLLLM